ncbi:hypothetical protein [Acinetobacter phage Ab69]|nr:hypothetical protein [Acinetobacter phage Ab69]
MNKLELAHEYEDNFRKLIECGYNLALEQE